VKKKSHFNHKDVWRKSRSYTGNPAPKDERETVLADGQDPWVGVTCPERGGEVGFDESKFRCEANVKAQDVRPYRARSAQETTAVKGFLPPHKLTVEGGSNLTPGTNLNR